MRRLLSFGQCRWNNSSAAIKPFAVYNWMPRRHVNYFLYNSVRCRHRWLNHFSFYRFTEYKTFIYVRKLCPMSDHTCAWTMTFFLPCVVELFIFNFCRSLRNCLITDPCNEQTTTPHIGFFSVHLLGPRAAHHVDWIGLVCIADMYYYIAQSMNVYACLTL